MHITTAVMKDGRTIKGFIMKFRPASGFMLLDCCSVNGGLVANDMRINFNDAVSITTEGERGKKRGESVVADELARARKYMDDARTYGWEEDGKKITPDWPVQEWQKGPTQ